MFACVKAPDSKVEYGSAVSFKSVIEALENASGPDDSPEHIHKEEFAEIITTREIRGQAKVDLLSQVGITVVDKSITSHQWQIKTTEALLLYDLNNPSQTPPLIIREDHQCWDQTSLRLSNCEIDANNQLNKRNLEPTSDRLKESLNDLNTTARHFNFIFEDQVYPFKQMEPDQCLFSGTNQRHCTYHDLNTQQLTIDPPKSVQDSEYCENLPDCKINATIVEFDEVNWKYAAEGYKIHYRFVLSSDVPQLSRRLQVCKQGSIQVKIPEKPIEEAPRFLVTFCDTVVNFKQGHP